MFVLVPKNDSVRNGELGQFLDVFRYHIVPAAEIGLRLCR